MPSKSHRYRQIWLVNSRQWPQAKHKCERRSVCRRLRLVCLLINWLCNQDPARIYWLSHVLSGKFWLRKPEEIRWNANIRVQLWKLISIFMINWSVWRMNVHLKQKIDQLRRDLTKVFKKTFKLSWNSKKSLCVWLLLAHLSLLSHSFCSFDCLRLSLSLP
jgi:hypothetical protein